MEKLVFRPNSAGYAVSPGSEVISVSLAGGFSRQRRDYLGVPNIVNVAWMCDEASYIYLQAWRNTVIAGGSLPFLCDLLLDEPNLTEHECRLVSGSFKLESTTAFIFNVVAQFEVKPIVRDADFDSGYFAVYSAYGSNSIELLELLAIFANDTLADEFV